MEFCLSCNIAVLVDEEEIDTGTCNACRGIERNDTAEPRALNFIPPRRERFVDGLDEFVAEQHNLNPEPEDCGLEEEEESEEPERGC